MTNTELCPKCGTPRALAPGSRYCITCGNTFPKDPPRPLEQQAIAHPPDQGPAVPIPPQPAVQPPASGPAVAPAGVDETHPMPLASEARAPWGEAHAESAPSAVPGAFDPARRRRYGILASIVAAVTVLAVVLGFVLTRGDGGAEASSWAIRFDQGENYRFRLEMGLRGTASSPELGFNEALDVSTAMTMSMQVLSVDAEGTATVKAAIEDATVEVNGVQQQAPSTGLSVEMRIARDGRVLSGGGLSYAAGGDSGFGLPGLDQFTPLLPDHEVEPGDTWSKDFDVPFPYGGGSLRYDTENRFLRYETVLGVQAAVIESDVTVPFDFTLSFREMFDALGEAFGGQGGFPADADPRIVFGGQERFTQTNWFDPSGGQVMRSEGNGSIDMEMRFEGFPEGEGGPGQGALRLIGSFELKMERLG